MERVKTLAETDVGKKAFKGLTSEVCSCVLASHIFDIDLYILL